jgi:membrane protease YdiL (CAAX protease family)
MIYISGGCGVTEKGKRKLGVLHIAIYLVIFFALWSIRELIIRPVFLDTLDGVVFQMAETVIKLLVWTLPAVLLIKRYQDDMLISLKEMFTNKPTLFKDASVLAVVFIVPLVQAWLSFGKLEIHVDFQPIPLISSVIFIGITEEMVFRGFLLNATLKKMKLWPAIILNAVLFLLIHFPFWIYLGFDISTFLGSCVSVAGLGALFAFAFVKTKNILIPIALHMSYNLLLALFFGS